MLGSSSWMPCAPQGVKELDDDDDDVTPRNQVDTYRWFGRRCGLRL